MYRRMLFRMLERCTQDSGQTMVLMPVIFLCILAVTGGVIDLGNAYWTQSRLQTALDSGSIAAAVDLAKGESQTAAVTDANQLVHSNGFSNTMFSMESSSGSDRISMSEGKNVSAQLTATVHVPTSFLRIFGITSIPVRVTSKAAGTALSEGKGMIPIGFPAQTFTYGQEVTVTESAGSGTAGNYSYLQLPGQSNSGASSLYNAITYGSPDYLSVGQSVTTVTGEKVGQVRTAIDARLSEPAPSYCSSWSTFSSKYSSGNYISGTCPQVAEMPVVDFSNVNGTSTVTIQGFVAFYIEGFTSNKSKGQQQLIGAYITSYFPGKASSSAKNYGTKSVRLVSPS